jgi:hypothetical protein
MIDGTLAISSSACFVASACRKKVESTFAATYARYEGKLFGRFLGKIGTFAEYSAKFVGKVVVIVSGIILEGINYVAFLEIDKTPVWFWVLWFGFFYLVFGPFFGLPTWF